VVRQAEQAEPTVVVSEQPGSDAARLVVDAVDAALSRRATARLAVAGGSAAAALGEVRRALASGGRWAKVALTWVDERCVRFDSDDSNRGAAYRAGHLRDDDPPGDELALVLDDEAPASAVARVTEALAGRFDGGLDVTLLGMGPDGHIASLFPGRRFDTGRSVIHVPDSPKPPPDRLTLTRPTLQTAARHILLATGEGKRAALERLLAGDATLPAVGLPGLTIVTDVEGLDAGNTP
jgi:6-phosphogluconolactonase